MTFRKALEHRHESADQALSKLSMKFITEETHMSEEEKYAKTPTERSVTSTLFKDIKNERDLGFEGNNQRNRGLKDNSSK